MYSMVVPIQNILPLQTMDLLFLTSNTSTISIVSASSVALTQCGKMLASSLDWMEGLLSLTIASLTLTIHSLVNSLWITRSTYSHSQPVSKECTPVAYLWQVESKKRSTLEYIPVDSIVKFNHEYIIDWPLYFSYALLYMYNFFPR